MLRPHQETSRLVAVLPLLLLLAVPSLAASPPLEAATVQRSPPSSPVPSRPALPALLPQYYINYGRCGKDLQRKEYGAWVMTRGLSQQKGNHSIIFELDTGNVSPVAPVFGTVEPADFPIRQLNLAYFDTRGVMTWSPALDKTPYIEVRSYYAVRVNGARPATTTRDLKDVGVPPSIPYSLKSRLNGAVAPSTSLYRIEIIKNCAVGPNGLGIAPGANTGACAAVPSPASVFLSPEGYFAYSFWGVGQALTVNGVYVQDHAWCPVQTGVTVP